LNLNDFLVDGGSGKTGNEVAEMPPVKGTSSPRKPLTKMR
jgi:hypothetical protein